MWRIGWGAAGVNGFAFLRPCRMVAFPGVIHRPLVARRCPPAVGTYAGWGRFLIFKFNGDFKNPFRRQLRWLMRVTFFDCK
ncbi:MAG: hypothetical protein WD397_13320, partial [Wenzhouxiangellaceae bacterium]